MSVKNNESVLISPTTRLESFYDASFISETPDFT